MQVVQQELEGLRRERPTLTPRPTRDMTALKDLINNDKVNCCTSRTVRHRKTESLAVYQELANQFLLSICSVQEFA